MWQKKRGQVWIETVTYTLIAFVLIGLVLGFARPKIQDVQDQAVIDQSIQIMKEIDFIIQEISEKGEGNRRKVELKIKKGEMTIVPENNSIEFFIEGNHMYSEPGVGYEEGSISVLTIQKGKFFQVFLEKRYENLDITFNGKEIKKTMPQASTPYTIYITNKGEDNHIIDFEVE
jgi:archaellum component FlaG (FlaF/FlaG flagellin family)